MKSYLILSLLLVSAAALLTCVQAAPAKDKWEEFALPDTGITDIKTPTKDEKKPNDDQIDIPIDGNSDNSWDKSVPKKVSKKKPVSHKKAKNSGADGQSVEDFLKGLNIPHSGENSGQGKWKLEKKTQDQDAAIGETFPNDDVAKKPQPSKPKIPAVIKKEKIKQVIPEPVGYVKKIVPGINYAKKNYEVSKNLIVSMKKLSKVVKKMVSGLVSLSKAIKKLTRTPKKIIREIEEPKVDVEKPKIPKIDDFPLEEPKGQQSYVKPKPKVVKPKTPIVKKPPVFPIDDLNFPDEFQPKPKPKPVVKKPKAKKHPDEFMDKFDLDDKNFKFE